MKPRFKVGDEPVIAFFKEHSISTSVWGKVVDVKDGFITVQALDGWEGEAGNTITVPEKSVEWDG